ncbi:hypothetical protein P691DRAFT_770652 [Macrolepiota fuliginosa MF-IS2]|uniref:Uncharacterized protein n=1 Tax=Macrolepiota fuliginosa MF-IS2 TaxID=1400762 RepID=A0A9P5XN03_9AGAR|nr:hypothetical protein P691DRAFT_770652 [Macrolepiota fuliginosa MF-IS2]
MRKERKRAKKPDVRARRKKIDMTKFGSVYLKGRFLDVDVPEGVGVGGIVEEGAYMRVEDGSSEDEGEEAVEEDDEEREDEDEKEDSELEEEAAAVQPTPATARLPSPPPAISTAKPQPPQPTPAPTSSDINLTLEKQNSMNILASLFGASSNDDEDAWIGKESPGSDVDEADLQSAQSRVQTRGAGDDDIDFELVLGKVGRWDALHWLRTSRTLKQRKRRRRRKETEGFSLLGHLNLDVDLELDEDVPFYIAHDGDDLVANELAVGEQTAPVPTSVPPPSTAMGRQTKQTRTVPQITLDPSKPLFSPLAMLSAHSTVTPSFVSSVSTDARGRPKDLYDTLAAKGWDWRSTGFCRTQNKDEIREKWEREKGELTRGWKKRWKEAGRVRRRGKGAGAGAGGEDV